MLVAPLAQEWDVGVWNVPMPRPTEGQVLPWTPYREAQRDWAEEHGVEQVSMAEAFRTAPGDKARLFTDNMHPSVTGAAVMAQAIVARLREQPGLLGLSERSVKRNYRPPPLPLGNGMEGAGAPGQRPPGSPPAPPGSPPAPPGGPAPGGH